MSVFHRLRYQSQPGNERSGEVSLIQRQDFCDRDDQAEEDDEDEDPHQKMRKLSMYTRTGVCVYECINKYVLTPPRPTLTCKSKH